MELKQLEKDMLNEIAHARRILERDKQGIDLSYLWLLGRDELDVAVEIWKATPEKFIGRDLMSEEWVKINFYGDTIRVEAKGYSFHEVIRLVEAQKDAILQRNPSDAPYVTVVLAPTYLPSSPRLGVMYLEKPSGWRNKKWGDTDIAAFFAKKEVPRERKIWTCRWKTPKKEETDGI